jgi:hypothetical protein
MIRDRRRTEGYTIHRIREIDHGMDYRTTGWALLKDGDLVMNGDYQPILEWAKKSLPDFPDPPPEGSWLTASEFEILGDEKRLKEEGPSALRTAGLFFEVLPDAPFENVQKQAIRIAKENRQNVNFALNGTLHTVYPNGQIVHVRPKRKRKLNA